jgi:hypothetical protein
MHQKQCPFCKKIFLSKNKFCSKKCANSQLSLDRKVEVGEDYIKNHSEVCALTGCWMWKLCKGSDGYGRSSGKIEQRAHRLSYRIFKGDFDSTLLVCHSCDTPACVNPSHLFLGTYQDNHDDMRRKGRKPKGEEWSFTKLTESDVKEVLRLKQEGFTYHELAKMFSVNWTTLWKIVKKKNWSHIA